MLLSVQKQPGKRKYENNDRNSVCDCALSDDAGADSPWRSVVDGELLCDRRFIGAAL